MSNDTKTTGCIACAEGMPVGECPASPLACGHHDDASWEQDCCGWCGAEFGEDDARYCACGELITNGSDQCLGCYCRHAATKEA